LIGLFICLARFVDQVVSQKSQICGAEMRILQASKNQLVQIISVMVLIVLGSCTVLPVPKHIEVTYPVVNSRNKNTVQSPVLNSFNRELWLNSIVQLDVPIHTNNATIERELRMSVSYMRKTDDGAVDTLSLGFFAKGC